MAANITKDTNESIPVSIDTTILKINIKTTGDLKTKDYDLIPFHPNMADIRDLSNNSYILFPFFVKITLKDLQKAGIGSDYPSVFMNLDKYIKLIKYVSNPDKTEEDYTLLTNKSQIKDYTMSFAQNVMADTDNATISLQKYEQLTDEEIIVNNIELIKSLFFAVKSHFYILGNEYVIGQSSYISPYLPSNEKIERLSTTTKKIPLNYTITIELQLLDAANNPEAGDFMKMTCKAKKGNIAKDMKDILGFNFGYIPELKTSTPSILNTTEATKNRRFGKIQHEWEKRNKYVKAPANEQERIALEKNWTPLQHKMAEYDKQQDAYNRIPPLWIKERSDLSKKYDDFATVMVNLWSDMKDIKESNTDNIFVKEQLNEVRTKMYAAIIPLGASKKNINIPNEDQIKQHRATVDGINMNNIILNETRQKINEYNNIKKELADKKITGTEINILNNYEQELNKLAENIIILKEINDFIKTVEESSSKEAAKNVVAVKTNNYMFLTKAMNVEKNVIDDKYITALFKGTKYDELQEHLHILNESEKMIYEKLKSTNSYNAPSVKVELAKVQTDIRKKKVAIKMIEDKYKKETMINNWEKTIEKMNSIKNTIDSEKTKGEKTILNKSVKEEMNKLFDKEIKKLNEEYLIALFKEGKDENLTSSEKEKFEKKDRPIDSSEQIKANINSLKTQYLEIAGKLGFFNKIQGEINLLTDDMIRYKELKLSKETEKKKINDKIRDISTELGRIGSTNPSRTATLKEEQKILQDESIEKQFDTKIKENKTNEDNYKNYIRALKGIPDNLEAQQAYINLKLNSKNSTITTKTLDEQTGGKATRKHIHNRRKPKCFSRRYCRNKKLTNNNNKTLRRIKKQKRRKYTR